VKTIHIYAQTATLVNQITVPANPPICVPRPKIKWLGRGGCGGGGAYSITGENVKLAGIPSMIQTIILELDSFHLSDMALPMLLPGWAWILAAVLLGVMTAGTIGVVARRQAILGLF